MEIYLFIIGLLIGLAIFDLIGGVSNDAVNFVNSLIGSRVAPRHRQKQMPLSGKG